MSALEDEIERIVRKVLAEHAAPVGTFDTRRLPPDVRTRTRFHAIVKAIPSATKRGRTWSVSKADWEAHRDGRAAADPDSVEATAARMLSAGYRGSP